MKTGNVLADFEWSRAADGYRWEGSGARRFLVPSQDDGKPQRHVKYRLEDKKATALFMEFAALGDDADAHLAFANRFGMLGSPVTSVKTGRSWEPIDPEPYYDTKTPGVFEHDKYGARLGEFFSLDVDRFPMSSWLGMSHLMAKIVHARQHRPGANLDWLVLRRLNTALHLSVRTHLVEADSDEGYNLRIRPISLIGAMWLQTGQALTRPKEFRRCVTCQTLIEVSRETGARSDAMFCSDACKSKDLRQRRAEARRLASTMTAAQIAKRVRSDVATVKRWIE